MTGRSHILVSGTTAFAIGRALNLEPEPAGWLILGAAATALLPDQLEVLGMGHRGPTHTLLACVCVVVAVTLGVQALAPAWTMVAGGAVAIGFGTHLLADACTLSGCPLVAPFWSRDVHLMPRGLRIRTGSLVEFVFQACVVLALASYVARDYLLA